MVDTTRLFDAGLGLWQDWQSTPWGRLFYRQAEANLGRHVQSGSIGTVLDLGGGNGADAIWLAERGHHVTIVDFSAEMLAAARAAYGAAGHSDRLDVIQADVTTFAGRSPGETYDLVLCHNLLQYLPDPAATLAAASGLTRPGGLLSVIAINKHSVPLRKATLDLDPVAALAAVEATESWTPTFHTTLRPYTADEVIAWLAPPVHDLLGHYGIRAVSDYINDNGRKADPEFFAALERLEFALADRLPYPLIARFFHLVTRVTAR